MPSKPHTIIGIDPGTLVAGYAVIMKDKYRPLQAHIEELGSLTQSYRNTPTQRLVGLHQFTAELMHRYQPQVVVIEKAFFGINAASALKLGEARGAIICACGSILPDTKIVEIAPAQVKKHITGKGNASKQQVANALAKMLRHNFKSIPRDTTDALALAFCHHLTSLPLRPVPTVPATHGSVPRSNAGRRKTSRAQLSCVPAMELAKPQQSDPNSKH